MSIQSPTARNSHGLAKLADALHFWELCSLSLQVQAFRPVDFVGVLHRQRDNVLWQFFVRSNLDGLLDSEYQ